MVTLMSLIMVLDLDHHTNPSIHFHLSTILKALHAAFLLPRAARNWLATQAT